MLWRHYTPYILTSSNAIANDVDLVLLLIALVFKFFLAAGFLALLNGEPDGREEVGRRGGGGAGGVEDETIKG